ncbi:hypothetical protein DYB28_004304 [Aphanomyces astaci]|uniref:Uncharacterized protein n=1 Tax=Aphanomyces astaci TaxID=112090 RepID=A0A9X8E585_APHAT|nr:hypothetical protein DYB28_004304 [Aphanomyces astaci]
MNIQQFTIMTYEKAAVPVPLKVKRCLVGDDDDNRSNVSDTWKDDYVNIDFSSPVKPKYNRNTTLTRAEAVRTTLEFVKDLPTYEADHPLVTCSVVRAAVKLKYGFVPKASFTSDACKATIDAHATAQLHKDTKNYRPDARSKDAFESSMLTLKANLPRAYQYLVDIQPGSEGWVQYNELGFAMFGTKTSNASEENNSWLGVLLRSSDPVSAYYQYMCKLLLKFNKQRAKLVSKRPNFLVDAVLQQVERSINYSKEYHVQNIGKYKVRHTFLVEKCTTLTFQLAHARAEDGKTTYYLATTRLLSLSNFVRSFIMKCISWIL